MVGPLQPLREHGEAGRDLRGELLSPSGNGSAGTAGRQRRSRPPGALHGAPDRDWVGFEEGVPFSWLRGTLPVRQSVCFQGRIGPGEVPFLGA